jgi:hypothetical protein
MEYSHYEEVPSPLQTKIISASKAERDRHWRRRNSPSGFGSRDS